MRNPPTKLPNILLIHWHDLGKYLGCYGWSGIPSPNVDRLAREGIRFDRAFTCAPSCSPSRAALFTGRYPHSNGVNGLVKGGWEYRSGVRTLPMYLCDAGYHTALIGQQHESRDADSLGFNEVYVNRQPPYLEHCERVTPQALEFLDRCVTSDQPFFASVGFFEVHRFRKDNYPAYRYPPEPMDNIPIPGYLPDNPAVRGDLAGFAGSIRRADAATGQILDHLDALGLRENTWVIFTTDHGMAFPRAKATLYDPGLETALIHRWPTGFPGGGRTSQALAGHVDLVPTLLDMIGADVPPEIEGVSYRQVLAGTDSEGQREYLFGEKTYHMDYDPIRCIRTARYKLIRNFERMQGIGMASDIEGSPSYRSLPPSIMEHPRPEWELYDLESDPWERDNLSEDPGLASIRTKLANELHKWMETSADPLLKGPVPPANKLE